MVEAKQKNCFEIVSDAACDLTAEYCEKNQVYVLSSQLQQQSSKASPQSRGTLVPVPGAASKTPSETAPKSKKQTSLYAGVPQPISSEDFYVLLATSKHKPRLNPPSVSDYLSLYRELKHEGSQAIISLHSADMFCASFGAASTAAGIVSASETRSREVETTRCSSAAAFKSGASPKQFAKNPAKESTQESIKELKYDSNRLDTAVPAGTTPKNPTLRDASIQAPSVQLVDTRLGSAAQGLIVKELVYLRDEGLGAEEAVKQINDLIESLHFLFVPGNKKSSLELISHQKNAVGDKAQAYKKFLNVKSFLKQKLSKKEPPLLGLSAKNGLQVISESGSLSQKSGMIARVMSGVSQEKGELVFIEICAGIPGNLRGLEKSLDTNEFEHERLGVVNVGAELAAKLGLGAIGVVFVPRAKLHFLDEKDYKN